MHIHLLLSIISDDKPGIVEAIAETIADAGGNWLESSLSKLAGKFAGIIRVSVAHTEQATLESRLRALETREIWIRIEQVVDTVAAHPASAAAYVHVLGPDRPGIVKELSHALVINRINLAKLETALSSMPYSGDPLFEAHGELEIPSTIEIDDLRDTLGKIADHLALDISLSDQPIV